MRILELSANQSSFRTVTFNRSGVSLVVGRRKSQTDKNREHSYNGVGKSLLLYLVDFCLGGRENDDLAEKLPGWAFTLQIELGDEEVSISRSVDKQKEVNVGGETWSLDHYRRWLGEEVFELVEPIKYLTFRSLMGLFIRQGKGAYMSFDQVYKQEQERTRQLRTVYLLGLAIDLATKKQQLREEGTRLRELKKNFKKDQVLRDYFTKDRDVDLEFADIVDEVRALQDRIDSFSVAKDYEEIEQEAEDLRRRWRQERDREHLIERSIAQIERTLQEKPDVDLGQVAQLFEAAQSEIPDAIKKQLDEVQEFHSRLLDSREQRLSGERRQLLRDLENTREQRERLEQQKDKRLQFLGGHGALSEYQSLVVRLAERRVVAERLGEYKRLEEEYKTRAARNKLEMQEENVRTGEYLIGARPLVDAVGERFRGMARRIYPQHKCGLIIRSDEGENLRRFEIAAKIVGDASDGIGEVALFCFDLTVLLEKRRHDMHFVMHDSRLFPGIDVRQRSELFRLAHELANRHDFQYIASMNEDTLDAMKGVMEPEDFVAILEDSVVMNLTDESDKSKLLGVGIDLVYEKRKTDKDQ